MSFDRRKIRTGTVVSDKMDKTIVVDVSWRSSHRLYKKAVSRRTRLYVHDPANDAKLGDLVTVTESRPFSKTKRWRLTQVLTRADLAEIQPDEITVEDESVLVAQREAPPDHAADVEVVGFSDAIDEAVEEETVDEIDGAVAVDEAPEEEVEATDVVEEASEEVEEASSETDMPVAQDETESPEAEDESGQATSEVSDDEDVASEADEIVAEDETESPETEDQSEQLTSEVSDDEDVTPEAEKTEEEDESEGRGQ